MKKRVLSLLLCFVLAAGLLSVCAPPAQAGTIADAFEMFIKQPGQIKKLFGREVAHGDCGPAGDEASVHYKIYEVTNPTVVQDNPFLQQIWQIHDYREDAQYYGVYIFGDGKMADYTEKMKAPWMGNVEVTEYNDKGQVIGSTVVEGLGEEYLALAYIAGIGGARAGIMETTFHDETETDLFGEQTVLCGGVVDLMQCGFETLVEAGYAPENAYFECIHEMKLIIDLINKGGVAAMNYSISDTAEFGEYVSGPRVLPHEETKARMRAVLADIQDGTFAGRWIAENKSRGRTFFNSKRDQLAKHPMEQVGEELRRNMIWGGDKDLDTASN